MKPSALLLYAALAAASSLLWSTCAQADKAEEFVAPPSASEHRYRIVLIGGPRVGLAGGAEFEELAELLAHASEPAGHAGSETPTEPGSEEPQSLSPMEMLQAAPLEAAILFGPLTASGDVEEARRLTAWAENAAPVVLLCPAPGEREAFTAVGVKTPAAFRHGPDGFILLSGDALHASAQAAVLHRMRRDLMPCRWTFAVSDRYSGRVDMRTQLVLFVDHPVDALLAGRWELPEDLVEDVDDDRGVRPVPWGGIRGFQAPASNGEGGPLAARELLVGRMGVFPGRLISTEAEETVAAP